MSETRYDVFGVIVEYLLPWFALFWWACGDMLSEVSRRDRRLDGHRLEVIVVVTYAIYGIVSCLSESMGCVSISAGCMKKDVLFDIHGYRTG